MAFTVADKNNINKALLQEYPVEKHKEFEVFKSKFEDACLALMTDETQQNWTMLFDYLKPASKAFFQPGQMSVVIYKLQALYNDFLDGDDITPVVCLSTLSPNSSGKTTLPASSPHTSPISLAEVNIAETISMYSGETIRHADYPTAFFSKSERTDRINEQNSNLSFAMERWLQS